VTGFPLILADVYLDPDGPEKPVFVAIEMDQRDQRRATMPTVMGGAGLPSLDADPVWAVRGMAWACLTRTQRWSGTFADFELVCIGVDLEPYAKKDAQVDPTWSAPAP
jgi:hypothetical protein